jgi:hypothetical protein
VIYHAPVVQGSDEWHAMRCGLITASEVKLLLTPKMKVAANDKVRGHVFELAAQRISGFVEPSYVGDNMLRGWADEIEAVNLYGRHFSQVEACGFITNDKWGFTLGYSPDGLVGSDGLIECKSRRQKFQVETFAAASVPDEFWLQCQTGLLVSEREWLDFVSYSAGLPMAVIRVEPCAETQAAIIAAAESAERQIAEAIHAWGCGLQNIRNVPTERRASEEMFIG